MIPADVCAAVLEAELPAVDAAVSEAAAVVEEAAVDTVVSVPADLADLLEAQPVRTTPAAMSENTTEILIFVVRLFMGIAK